MDRNYKTSSASHGNPWPASALPTEAPPRVESAIVFAGFRLQPDGALFRGQEFIHLAPRELAALQLLLANAGQIVTAAQIKQALWGDVNVTANSVPRCLSSLRASLKPGDCIQTVYKRGYRLAAPVRRADSGPAEQLPRLAILPFACSRGVPEHLGAAIAEETAARLSNARQPIASILARDSVFTLAARGMTAAQTGAALRADLVLAGSLQSLFSQIRLRAEMIRVADGIQIWVEDLLVSGERIADLEVKLSERLASRLQSPTALPPRRHGHSWGAGLASEADKTSAPQESSADSFAAASLPADLDRLEANAARPRSLAQDARRTASTSVALAEPVPGAIKSPRNEAYEIFLRGHHEGQSLERHRIQDGLQHLSRAIDLDPSLVAARLELVRLCVTQAAFGYMQPTMAREIAHRALESVPEHEAEPVLPSLGIFSFHVDLDLPAALGAFSSSAHLPHDGAVTRSRVMFALSRGRIDEALALLDAALDQDPFAPWLHARRAWALHLAARHYESLEQIKRSMEMFPHHDGVALYGAIILPFNGDAGGGLRLAEALSARMPSCDQVTALHAYALACADRKPEARALIARLRWLGRERFVSSSFNAAACVVLGDMESALADLRAAMDARCPWFFQMLADPRLVPLHGNHEFEQLRASLPRMEAMAAATRLDEVL